MRKAQKGIGNNTKEPKHQILVHRAVFYDFKMRQTNLSTTWIDFKNTCDSVLSKWIVECLALYKAKCRLITFIRNSFGLTVETRRQFHKSQLNVEYTEMMD